MEEQDGQAVGDQDEQQQLPEKLVESMTRRLAKVIEEERATIGYYNELKINICLYVASVFCFLTVFCADWSCLIAATVLS